MQKLKIFVARSWNDEDKPVGEYIIKQIEKVGFEVSKAMDKKGLENIELKEAMNIVDANGFCVIITPHGDQFVSHNVRHEINTATEYEIPSFVFVERAYMGDPVFQREVKSLAFGLNIPRQWYEFSRKDLQSGKEDENIQTYLEDVKRWLEMTSPEVVAKRDFALASLFAKGQGLAPFQVGLEIISDAYNMDPSMIYKIAAKAAASITGARFGFVGFLERNNERKSWTKILIRGSWGVDDKVKISLENSTLGFDDDGNTTGITGHVASSGDSFIGSDLDINHKKLKNERNIHFIDPSDIGIKSELCVPILLKGKVIGVIDVEDTHPSFFKPIHQKLLQWLARVIALAYSGDQLEEFIKKLSKTDPRNIESFARTILDSLINWSQADYGFIAFSNPKTKCCKVQAIYARDLDEKTLADFNSGSLYVEQGEGSDYGITGFVLKNGEALYIDDVKNDKKYSTYYMEYWNNTISEIVLPIRNLNEQTLGVVNLEFNKRCDFRELDKELFVSVANLIAHHLPNLT